MTLSWTRTVRALRTSEVVAADPLMVALPLQRFPLLGVRQTLRTALDISLLSSRDDDVHLVVNPSLS